MARSGLCAGPLLDKSSNRALGKGSEVGAGAMADLGLKLLNPDKPLSLENSPYLFKGC